MTLTSKLVDGVLLPYYWDEATFSWAPVPVDEFNFPTVEWLRETGAEIERSEVKVERHRSVCGKVTYRQGYRMDYYREGARIPIQGQTNETRDPYGAPVACWPISNQDM